MRNEYSSVRMSNKTFFADGSLRSVGSMRSMHSVGSRASSVGGPSRSQVFLNDYQERELKEELKREQRARTVIKGGKARVKQVSITCIVFCQTYRISTGI